MTPRTATLVAMVAMSARPLLAQARVDSVVADLHLGGDSVQAAEVPLLGREVYLLEITPARAAVQLRHLASNPEPALALRPVADRAPPPNGVVLAVVAQRPGRYLLELTNPAVGATHVRIIWEAPATSARTPVAWGDAARIAEAAREPEVTILDETFPGPSSIVLLTGDNAYRIEAQPPGAAVRISIRSARNASGPPMPMYPTTGGPGLILVPPATGEYRLDVATRDEPVRVRIIKDPRETARWFRIADQTRNLPKAGISVRAAYIGPFPRPSGGGTDTIDVLASGLGADVCFGVVPRGGWLNGPIGGCVLSLAYYQRDHLAGTFTASISPRLLLSRRDGPTQVSLGVSAGIGATTQSTTNQTYFLLGLSGVVERQIGERWLLEAEAGITGVSAQQTAIFPVTAQRSATVPRLAVGLQYRP